MKKLFELLYSAFCLLSITLPGDVLATPVEELLVNLKEPVDQPGEKDVSGKDDHGKDCHLAFVTGDFGLQTVSMDAGEPISTLLLFISGTDGRIIKDAQVITTIIDQQGNQQLNRAQPFKGGYMIAVDHLPLGQYRVETEIVTDGQLLTDEFRFNKA
jgi:hypothetical protein